MGKRKRNVGEDVLPALSPAKKTFLSHKSKNPLTHYPICIQIITGSYDRVLHGITVTIPPEDSSALDSKILPTIHFSDNFLFNAHSSAIRCLAISPISRSKEHARAQKLILASGGTDERINLYHISAHSAPIQPPGSASLPSLSSAMKQENPKNKELGALLHHSASINALYFPTRSKLMSGAEDNTIAFARTRDWAVLSTVKAPIPKSVGRPSGDTAPPGNAPTGINDFAVDPSKRVMISVGKGEKCMRLWDLVTGKKSNVLNFGRELLQSIGEGRYASGEGFKVRWNIIGHEFAVLFSRGAVIFGMVRDCQFPSTLLADSNIQDARPKCRLLTSPLTKLHQIHYIHLGHPGASKIEILAVSTEDGHILFYSTNPAESVGPPGGANDSSPPLCRLIAWLGGKSEDMTGRLKDFEVLVPQTDRPEDSSVIIVAAGSDGSIKIWRIKMETLTQRLGADQNDKAAEQPKQSLTEDSSNATTATLQIGQFLGTYKTENRITCLKAFILRPQEPHYASTDGPDIRGEFGDGETQILERSVQTGKSTGGEDEDGSSDMEFEGFD